MRAQLVLILMGLWLGIANWEPTAMAQPTDQAVEEALPKVEYRVIQERPDRLVAVLPNRLIIIAQELHASPVVAVQGVVKTGSIYEQEHVGAGLSHFLEHLVAGGATEKRDEAASRAELSRIGAQTNASTSLAGVRYYIHTTSDHTSEAIDLVSDWLQNSRIPQREYERERDVIQREFEMGRGDPARIFWRLTQQARYRFHPARHPTIGYIDEFLAISRDGIYDFYKRMYVPNNTVFVVAGDIDKEAVVEQVAKLWGDVPAAPLPELKFPVEPKVSQPKELTGAADIRRPRVRLSWPGTRVGGEGDYALDLVAVILGQGESSRLVRIVRDEKRAVNAIEAYNLSFPWGEGFFGVDSEVADMPGEAGQPALSPEEGISKVRDLVLEQVTRLRQELVTPEELARAKRQVMASVTYDGQSVQALSEQLSQDVAGMGDPDYHRRYAERIQAITAEELRDAARQILDPQRLITVRLLPMAQGQPFDEPKRPADAVPDANVAYETVDIDNAALIERMTTLALQPKAGKEIAVDRVRRFELANGMRVLIGRSTLVPAVSIQLYQVGGLLADEQGKEGVSKAIAEMRMRGTMTHSAEEIARLVDNLGARISTDSGYNSNFTTSVCLKEDFPTVLELFSDVVLNPSFPEAEWQKIQPRLLAAIDRQTDTWIGELRKTFRETYYGAHQWSLALLGRREIVAALTAQDLANTYRNRLDAEENVLAIFGDVDVEAALTLARQHFGSMPRKPELTLTLVQPQSPTPTLRQVTTNKPLGAVQIGFGPGVTRADPDYPAIEVLTSVLSRFPSGWLEQQLRGEGEGLVYAVSCGQFTGLMPGYVAILFNATPEKVPDALSRSAQVVDRARTELVDEQTLADAKAAVLSGEFLARQSNCERAAQFALDELYGLGLNESEQFNEHVRQLDAESLRNIARKYLRSPITVILTHDPLPEEVLKKAAGGL